MKATFTITRASCYPALCSSLCCASHFEVLFGYFSNIIVRIFECAHRQDHIQHQQQQKQATGPAVSASSPATSKSFQRSSGSGSTSTGRRASVGGVGVSNGTVSQHRQPHKRELNLRYTERPVSGMGASKGRDSIGADGGHSSGSGRRGARFDGGGAVGGAGEKGAGARRGHGGGRRDGDENMML